MAFWGKLTAAALAAGSALWGTRQQKQQASEDRKGREAETAQTTYWTPFRLEEYKSLRQECLASSRSQQATLGYGLAMIVLIVALGLDHAHRLLGILLYGLAVPALAIAVYALYAHQAARLIRARHYLVWLEETGGEFGWECWLASEVNGWTPRLPFRLAAPITLFGAALVANLVPCAVILKLYWWAVASAGVSGMIIVWIGLRLSTLASLYDAFLPPPALPDRAFLRPGHPQDEPD